MQQASSSIIGRLDNAHQTGAVAAALGKQPGRGLSHSLEGPVRGGGESDARSLRAVTAQRTSERLRRTTTGLDSYRASQRQRRADGRERGDRVSALAGVEEIAQRREEAPSREKRGKPVAEQQPDHKARAADRKLTQQETTPSVQGKVTEPEPTPSAERPSPAAAAEPTETGVSPEGNGHAGEHVLVDLAGEGRGDEEDEERQPLTASEASRSHERRRKMIDTGLRAFRGARHALRYGASRDSRSHGNRARRRHTYDTHGNDKAWTENESRWHRLHADLNRHRAQQGLPQLPHRARHERLGATADEADKEAGRELRGRSKSRAREATEAAAGEAAEEAAGEVAAEEAGEVIGEMAGEVAAAAATEAVRAVADEETARAVGEAAGEMAREVATQAAQELAGEAAAEAAGEAAEEVTGEAEEAMESSEDEEQQEGKTDKLRGRKANRRRHGARGEPSDNGNDPADDTNDVFTPAVGRHGALADGEGDGEEAQDNSQHDGGGTLETIV